MKVNLVLNERVSISAPYCFFYLESKNNTTNKVNNK